MASSWTYMLDGGVGWARPNARSTLASTLVYKDSVTWLQTTIVRPQKNVQTAVS